MYYRESPVKIPLAIENLLSVTWVSVERSDWNALFKQSISLHLIWNLIFQTSKIWKSRDLSKILFRGCKIPYCLYCNWHDICPHLFNKDKNFGNPADVPGNSWSKIKKRYPWKNIQKIFVNLVCSVCLMAFIEIKLKFNLLHGSNGRESLEKWDLKSRLKSNKSSVSHYSHPCKQS